MNVRLTAQVNYDDIVHRRCKSTAFGLTCVTCETKKVVQKVHAYAYSMSGLYHTINSFAFYTAPIDAWSGRKSS